ncbi:MAG TPA: ABC transporter permease, partial [Longimicrobiales bacterium]|nr:ABC transporter permease [Longimicrobiales bacterium]
MRWWKWLRMRLRALVRAESLDRELDEEFSDHLEREIAARVRAGAAPAVARREALIAFGGLDRIREDVHDARGVRLVEDVRQDLRYGVRILRRTPAFAVVVVAILALGIGLTSALFAAVYGVLLKPLPYRNADDVVVLWQSQPSAGHPRDDFSPANFMDVRDATSAFSRLAAAWQHGVDYMGDEGPETWQAWAVTEGFFDVLGVDAAAGRLFAATDHAPDAPRTLLLTHEFWQRRFGAEPGVVGTRVTLDDVVWEIAGVLPAAFRFPTRTQVFLPAAMSEEMRQQRGATYLTVVGQLPPGASPTQVDGELDALASRLAEQYPRTNAGVDFVSVPLAQQITGDVRPLLIVLMSAVALLLLVACSNVANLFLARTTAREGEFALRGALGARGLRLARQLLAECAVLAAAGGAAGLLLAYYGVALIRAFAPADLPRIEEITFEPRVAAFAVVVSSLTVFVFALLPALRASRASLHGGMLTGSVRATPGMRRRRASRMLVVAEVAFSFVLVIAAGLVVRSFVKLTSVDPGYRTEGVATMSVFLWGRYNSPEQQVSMIAELEERVRALPGIVAFGVSTSLPMHERIGREDADVVAEGAVVAPGEAAVVRGAAVTPGYFDALHIPLLRGRLFTVADDARGEPVAVISESLAAQHFPGKDPIGRTI